MSNEKRAPGWLGKKRDEKNPTKFIERDYNQLNHDKDSRH